MLSNLFLCFTAVINIIKVKCLLILRNGKIGPNIGIFGNVRLFFRPGCNIHIGRHLRLVGGGNINPIDGCCSSCIAVENGAKLFIGDYVSMSGVHIYVHDSVSIGSYCMIGANVLINDSNNHSIDYAERRNEFHTGRACNIQSKPIRIGDDVFIGARSIIGKGVSIGNKSIIGMGSVVLCDIPEGEVWGGNPARFIKKI